MARNKEGEKAIDPNGSRINTEVRFSKWQWNSYLTVFHMFTTLKYKKDQNQTSRDENYNV